MTSHSERPEPLSDPKQIEIHTKAAAINWDHSGVSKRRPRRPLLVQLDDKDDKDDSTKGSGKAVRD